MPATRRLPWTALLFACLTLIFASAAAPAAFAQGPDDGDDPAASEPWDDPASDDGSEDPADPADEAADVQDPSADEEWTPEDDWSDDDPRWGPDEPEVEPLPLVTTPTVDGKVAMLRTNGKAAIPRGAPARVRAIIAAANRIVGKPYKWGGGHAKLEDRGYDCSGAVSYALIHAGRLEAPLVSGSFTRWGAAGAGRWVTIYANKGHVYMEVAGLRLDTSTAGDDRSRKGVRWRPVIGRKHGYRVRHIVGL